MIAGYELCTFASDFTGIYSLIKNHYVDNNSFFKLDYSSEFVNWAVGNNCHVISVKYTETGELVGCITATPIALCVSGIKVDSYQINFLCVHKAHRNKGLASFMKMELEKKVTKECDENTPLPSGIFTICNSAGPSSNVFYHRDLNPKKLFEIGYTTHLPTSINNLEYFYRVPNEYNYTWNPVIESDVPDICNGLNEFLKDDSLRPVFDEKLVRRLFIGNNTVKTCVSRDNGIFQMMSMVTLPSTITKPVVHRHTLVKTLYMYYHIVRKGYQYVTKFRQDCLKMAKEQWGGDVFVYVKTRVLNGFIDDKFNQGNASLNYYHYTKETGSKLVDGGIGLVMF